MSTAAVAPDTDRAIAEARVAYEKALKHRSNIEARLKARRDSIEPLTRSISQAIAEGDDARAEKLRAERSAAEADLRDLEPAVAIANRAAESADRDFARLELPWLRAAFEADVRRFVALIAEANRLSSQILFSQQRYHERFSRADLTSNPVGDERHAKSIMARVLTPLARAAFNLLRDHKAD